jgi:hypothetical protein
MATLAEQGALARGSAPDARTAQRGGGPADSPAFPFLARRATPADRRRQQACRTPVATTFTSGSNLPSAQRQLTGVYAFLNTAI